MRRRGATPGKGGGWVGLGCGDPGAHPRTFPYTPGCPISRPAELLTVPRPRNGACGRVIPPCLCVSWIGRAILLQGTAGTCSPCCGLSMSCGRAGAVAVDGGLGGGGD